MIEDIRASKPKVQNLMLENRERLSISGIVDVESFNDECVVVDTNLGILIIRGKDLHINKLSIDSSELNIEGDIASLEYDDRQRRDPKGSSFFARMFR